MPIQRQHPFSIYVQRLSLLIGIRLLLLISTSLSVMASADEPKIDHRPKYKHDFYSLSHWNKLYGGTIDFSVTRNKKTVGRYQILFKGTEENWQVESSMALDFKAFLFFPYRFRYQGIEHWQQQTMTRFSSKVDRNGDISISQLQRTRNSTGDPFWQGGAWSLDDKITKETQPPKSAIKVLSTGDQGLSSSLSSNLSNLALSNHYNPSIIGQSLLFNSLSGQLNRIALVKEGIETVYDGQANITATRYRYTGDLKDTWVWYANDGRWVRMRFIADDGSRIQLNCQRCY